MAIVASMINMKGGVGKSTLAFNLGWYSAWHGNLRVLCIDLDPQANLSQYRSSIIGAFPWRVHVEVSGSENRNGGYYLQRHAAVEYATRASEVLP